MVGSQKPVRASPGPRPAVDRHPSHFQIASLIHPVPFAFRLTEPTPYDTDPSHLLFIPSRPRMTPTHPIFFMSSMADTHRLASHRLQYFVKYLLEYHAESDFEVQIGRS